MASHCGKSFRAFYSNLVKSLISIAILGWACASPLVARAEDAGVEGTGEITLDEINRRLIEWRNSFVNLRAVWELRSLPETNEELEEWGPTPDLANPAVGQLSVRREWIWADHGLDLFEGQFSFNKDGTSKYRTVDVFNGQKGVVFRANYERPPGGSEQFKDLRVRGVGSGSPISSVERVPTEGIYWPGFAAWLPEMFSKWDWNFQGIENVSGERCARIAAEWPNLAGAVETLWLDLEHDCLVRRKCRLATREMLGGDFIVDEFQKLDVGIWFPKRGRIQLGVTPHENQLFVVTVAEANQSLDLARFDPPKPAVGTVVDQNGKVYKHGAPAVPPGEGARSNDSPAGDNSKLAPSRLSAAPPTWNWLWLSAALATISVAFLSAGIWFSRRRRL
ncbi:MAG TPA: hypothetical protein VMV10_15730 [Pirellulales bacterium]|nr:hypothetical protein [Pirellulales bacterium]